MTQGPSLGELLMQAIMQENVQAPDCGNPSCPTHGDRSDEAMYEWESTVIGNGPNPRVLQMALLCNGEVLSAIRVPIDLIDEFVSEVRVAQSKIKTLWGS